MANDSSMQDVFNNLVTGLDKCTTALYDAADAFNGKGSGSSGTPRINNKGKSLDASLKDAEKMFDRSSKNTNQALTMQQKIGKTFITSLQAIGREFIREFKASINRVSSDYLSNLSSITTRMQLSNKEYAGLYNHYASKISKEFTGAFSVKDFSSALTTALDTGLRDTRAKEIAYQNMITTKLVPAISTNTREYTRNSKVLGEKFSQSVTAMYKHIESTLKDTTGLDEGQINNIIDTLGTNIRYLSKGDSEAANKAYESVLAGHAVMADQVGSKTADETLQILNNLLNGKLDNIAGMSAIGGTGDDLVKKLQSGELTFAGFYEKMQSGIQQFFSSDNPSVVEIDKVSEALGVSSDYVKEVLSAKHYGDEDFSKYSEIASKYNRTGTYGEQLQRLEEGYYTSADDYFSNQLDNSTTWMATAKSNFARFDMHLGLITTILGSIAANMFFTKTKGGQQIVNGAKGLFSKLGPIGPSAKQLPLKGLPSSGSSTSGFTKILGSTGAKVLGGVGGAIMIGSDIISAKKNGKSTGEALLAGVTGVTKDVDSGWDIAGNTAKNAAKGAAIGTVFGPWGTAIGAAVGAVSGLTHSLIEYNSETAKYERQLKSNTETVAKATEMAHQYEVVQTEVNTADEALEILRDKSKKGTQQYSQAYKTLQSQYPELLKGMGEDNELTEKQVNLLTELNKQKALENMYDLENSLKDKGETNDNIIDQYEKVSKENDKIIEQNAQLSTYYDAITKLENLVGSSEVTIGKGDKLLVGGKAATKEQQEAFDEWVKLFKNDYSAMGFSKEYAVGNKDLTVAHALNAASELGGLDIKLDYNAVKAKSKGIQGLWGAQETYGFIASDGSGRYWNGSGKTDKSSNLKAKETKDISSEKTNLLEQASNYNTLVQSYLNSDPIYVNRVNAQNTIKEYNKLLKSLVDNKLYTMDDLKSMFTAPSELVDHLGLTDIKGYYRVGTRNHTQDGVGMFHKGEMTLTSANADKLRSIESSGGISGIINGLFGLTRAKASPIDDSTSVDPVTSAIVQQTEVLSDLLSRILEAVTGISQIKNPTVATSVTVSDDLISFRGA